MKTLRYWFVSNYDFKDSVLNLSSGSILVRIGIQKDSSESAQGVGCKGAAPSILDSRTAMPIESARL